MDAYPHGMRSKSKLGLDKQSTNVVSLQHDQFETEEPDVPKTAQIKPYRLHREPNVPASCGQCGAPIYEGATFYNLPITGNAQCIRCQALDEEE